jgi:hypothetical protein
MALVPVLALTLGGVLLWPSRNGASATAGPRAKQPLPEIPQGGRAQATHQSDADFDPVDLATVLAFNPFAPPAPPREATAAGTAESAGSAGSQAASATATTDADKQAARAGVTRTVRRVSAVVQHNGHASAFLDGHFVTEGDTLPDGSRVVSITAERVTLEPK